MIWAIMTKSGTLRAVIEWTETPTAKDCGINMSGMVAVEIERAPHPNERVLLDGSIVVDDAMERDHRSRRNKQVRYDEARDHDAILARIEALEASVAGKGA